jgi:hypothetical protein
LQRDEFIQKCIEDPSTFDKPIKRIKNCTFALEGIVKKKKGLPGRSYIAVRMEWNLMGRVLAIALKKRVDMEQVFKLFTLRFIDVAVLAKKLGEQLSKAIPGFHAFAGCDYNPAFPSKGKIRHLKVLEANIEFQKAFSKLCENEDLQYSLVSKLE